MALQTEKIDFERKMHFIAESDTDTDTNYFEIDFSKAQRGTKTDGFQNGKFS